MRRILPIPALALAGALVFGCGGPPTPRITVTSPNGGEVWVVGESHDITWTSAVVTSNVDIHYTNDSTAGPVVWIEIVADVANSGSYPWTIPAVDSSNCRVRVQETLPGVLLDQSNADFTITPPTITVTSPNGNETWYYQGSDHEITWTSLGVAGNVDVHYTIDSTAGPVDWTEIVANVANSGSHTWTIPDNNSMLCLVRVQEAGGGLSDQSDGDFTIAQPPGVSFTDVQDPDLVGVSECSLAWGDYDNDDDLDLLVAGYDGATRLTTLYEYDAGDFVEETAAVLPDMHQCSVAWAEHRNDSDLSIAIGGEAFTGASAVVYRNLAAGQFMNEPSAQVMDLKKCSLAWGDFDNDGLVDIAIAGQTSAGFIESRISRNGGFGTFNEVVLNPELTGVYLCSLAWGDYDNDGDLDLALAGASSVGPANPVAKIYQKNADGQFTEETEAPLTAVYDCSLAWGDYDNDGDLDLAIAGWDPDVMVDAPVTKLYRNDGEGQFTEETGAGLTGVHLGSLAWGDYDNDGDLDLAIVGASSDTPPTMDPVAELYRNDGGGVFAEDTSISLTAVYACSVAWGDYDNDGDLDIALAGKYWDGAKDVYVAEVHENGLTTPNTAPTAPSGLSAIASGSEVTFSWDAATDAETHAKGLSYNLRVGRSFGDDDVFAGTADLTTGLQLLPAVGNAQENLSWTLKNLASDTYWWTVQAVDTGFRRSAWAPEGVVTVP